MSPNTESHIIVISSDSELNYLLERVLFAAGYSVSLVSDPAQIERRLTEQYADLVVIAERTGDTNGVDLANRLSAQHPAIPILVIARNDSSELLHNALRAGISDVLCLPLRSDQLVAAVSNALQRAMRRKEWVIIESKRATAGLQRRLDESETLMRLSRSITSTLDLDTVLTAVVDAAVELSGAEEGSLLLLDPATGDLYMRAARNFNEEFVSTFRLPVQDSLAGNVIRTGQPFILDEKTPKKIKTTYLVQGLLYVPLQIHGQSIGVLGVDHRQSHTPFSNHHVKVLSALADYAAIAIENARLYANSEVERSKLETILTQVQDGVIVVGLDEKVILANQAARVVILPAVLDPAGQPFDEVVDAPELIELVRNPELRLIKRIEIGVEDGRVFSVQLTPVPELGQVLSLHDITYLKKLDSLKSEFVSTVSHDLRSPLTAILGYIELIQRVGSINELQSQYIERVQVSVRNITSLVDDLLNLGRIEAGLDSRHEPVFLDLIVQQSVEGYHNQASHKDLKLHVEVESSLPQVYGNPIQIRQMVDNLIDNAAKYTPVGGDVAISLAKNSSQVVLKISDTGPGIQPADLPYVFDKFYRGANVAPDTTGTGLGLSIVKSIVESHQGSIWVDSSPEKGSTFTVVLPIAV